MPKIEGTSQIATLQAAAHVLLCKKETNGHDLKSSVNFSYSRKITTNSRGTF